MKTCSKCGIDKDETFFHVNRSCKDGLQKMCKTCYKEMNSYKHEVVLPRECQWVDCDIVFTPKTNKSKCCCPKHYNLWVNEGKPLKGVKSIDMRIENEGFFDIDCESVLI